MRSLRLLFTLPILLAACVNTDAAVFVDPTIETPVATVAGGALGVTISGNFKLNLHLGPRATGPSTVTLGAFSILDAGQKAAITSIQIGSTSTQFPATVELDSDVTAAMPFDLGGKTLPADAKAKLCDAAGVIIGGTIQDSLLGGSTPFFSPIIHPAGCM
jgi:hypothetical protein